MEIEKGKEEMFGTHLKNLFIEPKKSVFVLLFKGEEEINKAKDYFLSNFKSKENELTWDNLKKKIESFKVEMSVGGSCDLESKSCDLMINFCISLFKLKFDKFVFPITLCPYIDFAISMIPSINFEICFGFGSFINYKNSEENSFNIDLSGGASVGVTLDLGLYFPSVNSPIRLSFNVGLMGILGSGKVGFQLSLYYEEKFKVDLYYEFKAFELSFYVMFSLSFQIEILVGKIEFSFSFYLFQKIFGSLKYEHHNERVYKYSNSKLIEHNRITTNNGGRWGRKKNNDIISEKYE